MKTRAVYVLLAGLCSGCMHSYPEDDLGFAKGSNLDAFNGCYENRGEGEKDPKGVLHYYSRLSDYIRSPSGWGAVEAMEFKAISNEALSVTAYMHGRVMGKETFIVGKTLTFESGRIHIRSSTEGSAATQAGNPFIGVMHGSTVLGVDPEGNARLQDTVTFAGTAFIFIPVAGGARDVTRFRKTPSLCVETQKSEEKKIREPDPMETELEMLQRQ